MKVNIERTETADCVISRMRSYYLTAKICPHLFTTEHLDCTSP